MLSTRYSAQSWLTHTAQSLSRRGMYKSSDSKWRSFRYHRRPCRPRGQHILLWMRQATFWGCMRSATTRSPISCNLNLPEDGGDICLLGALSVTLLRVSLLSFRLLLQHFARYRQYYWHPDERHRERKSRPEIGTGKQISYMLLLKLIYL